MITELRKDNVNESVKNFIENDPSDFEDWRTTYGLYEGRIQIYSKPEFSINYRDSSYIICRHKDLPCEEFSLPAQPSMVRVSFIPRATLSLSTRSSMLDRLLRYMIYGALQDREAQQFISLIEGSTEVLTSDSFFRLR